MPDVHRACFNLRTVMNSFGSKSFRHLPMDLFCGCGLRVCLALFMVTPLVAEQRPSNVPTAGGDIFPGAPLPPPVAIVPAAPVTSTGVGAPAAPTRELPPASTQGVDGIPGGLLMPPAAPIAPPDRFETHPSVGEVKTSEMFPNPGPDDKPPGDGFALMLDVIDLVRKHSIKRPRAEEIGLGCYEQLQRIYGASHPNAFVKGELPTDGAIFDLFEKAVSLIAVAPGHPENVRRIIERAIAGYVRHIDRFGSYNNLAALELLEASDKQSGYTGTGLSLEETPDGRFILFPLPGESGDLAGIIPGDVLFSVDDRPVHGTNRIVVQSWLRGHAGSETSLVVLRAGRKLALPVTREIVRPSPIEVREEGIAVGVRIRKFDALTVTEMRELLLRLDPGRDLELDLRGCIGGEFDAGVAVAELLLPKGAEIAHLATGDGEEKPYLSGNSEPYQARSITILQDSGTASASELLIAALLRSAVCPVETKGTPTYGKGSSQIRKVLTSGGLLTLTDSRMYGPDHISWEQGGLAPTVDSTPPQH